MPVMKNVENQEATLLQRYSLSLPLWPSPWPPAPWWGTPPRCPRVAGLRLCQTERQQLDSGC